MRAALWLLALFGVAVAAALFAGNNQGTITLYWPPHRIDFSLKRVVLLLVTATMLGHMFARVGAATLDAKPWLYFMMSGGLATAFVIPALWISFSHIRVPTRVAVIDAGYWLAAYLAMGLVFFLAG